MNAVNFGSKPEGYHAEEKFANRRTELWWNLREWIRNDAALGDLNPDVKDVLRADLCAPKYEQKSDGRIALEPKKRIRDRTGRSPDHGDALALAVAGRGRSWAFGPPSPNDDDRGRKRTSGEELDDLFRDLYPTGASFDDW